MLPLEAGLYFNKIQCFCFDEQLLGPHEVGGYSSVLAVMDLIV